MVAKGFKKLFKRSGDVSSVKTKTYKPLGSTKTSASLPPPLTPPPPPVQDTKEAEDAVQSLAQKVGGDMSPDEINVLIASLQEELERRKAGTTTLADDESLIEIRDAPNMDGAVVANTAADLKSMGSLISAKSNRSVKSKKSSELIHATKSNASKSINAGTAANALLRTMNSEHSEISFRTSKTAPAAVVASNIEVTSSEHHSNLREIESKKSLEMKRSMSFKHQGRAYVDDETFFEFYYDLVSNATTKGKKGVDYHMQNFINLLSSKQDSSNDKDANKEGSTSRSAVTSPTAGFSAGVQFERVTSAIMSVFSEADTTAVAGTTREKPAVTPAVPTEIMEETEVTDVVSEEMAESPVDAVVEEAREAIVETAVSAEQEAVDQTTILKKPSLIQKIMSKTSFASVRSKKSKEESATVVSASSNGVPTMEAAREVPVVDDVVDACVEGTRAMSPTSASPTDAVSLSSKKATFDSRSLVEGPSGSLVDGAKAAVAAATAGTIASQGAVSGMKMSFSHDKSVKDTVVENTGAVVVETVVSADDDATGPVFDKSVVQSMSIDSTERAEALISGALFQGSGDVEDLVKVDERSVSGKSVASKASMVSKSMVASVPSKTAAVIPSTRGRTQILGTAHSTASRSVSTKKSSRRNLISSLFSSRRSRSASKSRKSSVTRSVAGDTTVPSVAVPVPAAPVETLKAAVSDVVSAVGSAEFDSPESERMAGELEQTAVSVGATSLEKVDSVAKADSVAKVDVASNAEADAADAEEKMEPTQIESSMLLDSGVQSFEEAVHGIIAAPKGKGRTNPTKADDHVPSGGCDIFSFWYSTS